MSVRLKKTTRPNTLFIFKELTLGALSVLSVGLVLFEFLGHPSERQVSDLARVDLAIACLFLLDFIIGLGTATNRKEYWHYNWYFLLAAIPLSDTLTESLRGLRVLALFRLVRAGGHLGFGVRESRRRGRARRSET